MDARVNAADAQGRICLGLQQDLADHGRRRGLSVRSADGDGHVVVPHQLAEELSSGQRWNALLLNGDIFWIVRADGCGQYGAVDAVLYVFSLLAVINLNSLLLEARAEVALCAVGAGDAKACVCKNLRKAAHADAADAYEVDGNGLL